MKNICKRILSIGVSGAMLLGTVSAFAENVTVEYSGSVYPGELVGFMITSADADSKNPDRDDIHTTDIIKADENGNFYKSVTFDDAEIDAQTGEVTNYKVVSSADVTANVLSDIYRFGSFTVTPVVENGVLYVPMKKHLRRSAEKQYLIATI